MNAEYLNNALYMSKTAEKYGELPVMPYQKGSKSAVGDSEKYHELPSMRKRGDGGAKVDVSVASRPERVDDVERGATFSALGDDGATVDVVSVASRSKRVDGVERGATFSPLGGHS